MDKKQKKILIILIISLIILDQIVKLVILGFNIKIGNQDLWNIGVISAERTDNNISYILIAIIAIIVLVRYIKSNNSYIKMDSRIMLSFAISGAASNLIDRIWKGCTINYINFPNFSSINLGYIYLIITWIGMAIILTKYTSVRIAERKMKKEVDAQRKEKDEKGNNSK